ncbi:MAG TPA: phosphate acyltransferase, partial [Thioalkalivibrio sp.]|nr:phosphate acyltransferase [Thioalkalivibrio sp.]
SHFIRAEFKRNLLTRFAALFAMPVLASFKKRIDPRLYNGASLLGLQGIVIKSHGGADVFSSENAIRIARVEVEKNVAQRIDKQLEQLLTERQAS